MRSASGYQRDELIAITDVAEFGAWLCCCVKIYILSIVHNIHILSFFVLPQSFCDSALVRD